jgi:hypothetical protein
MFRFLITITAALAIMFAMGLPVSNPARAAGAGLSAPSKYNYQTDHSPAAHNAYVRNSGI